MASNNNIIFIVGIMILVVIAIVVISFQTPSRKDKSVKTRSIMTPGDIHFGNIHKHPVEKNSYIELALGLYANFYHSVSHKLRNFISEEPQPEDNSPVRADVPSVHVPCKWPSVDSEHYDPITKDIFSKKTRNNTYNDGVSSLDEVSCEMSSGGRKKWGYDHSLGLNRCMCLPPFGGCSCEFELHSDNYLPVANQTDGFDMFVIDNFQTDRISFPMKGETACSDICDQNTECTGFVVEKNFEGYQCILLKNGVVAKPGDLPGDKPIEFDQFSGSSLYLKRSDKENSRIRFKDRVIIGKGGSVLRHWLENSYSKDGVRYDAVYPNKVTYINYVPMYIINDTGPEKDSDVNYGEAKTIVISSLPLSVETINNKLFCSNETMVVLKDIGLKRITSIPEGWTEVYVYVY